MATTWAQLVAAVAAIGGQETDLLADTFSVVNSEPPVISRRVDPKTGVATIEMRNN